VVEKHKMHRVHLITSINHGEPWGVLKNTLGYLDFLVLLQRCSRENDGKSMGFSPQS
jgi:hypothetical protein